MPSSRITRAFQWSFLALVFGQCTDLCSSPKYLIKHNIQVDTSGCMKNFTTREHCMSYCFENICIAALFTNNGHSTFCCIYYDSNDLYYFHGTFSLYYKSGINICEANQKPPSCTTCVGNYDPSLGCTTCIGNYDLSTGCKKCTGNFAPSSQCTNCKWNWAGEQCDVCDFGLKGSNCTRWDASRKKGPLWPESLSYRAHPTFGVTTTFQNLTLLTS